MSDNVGITDAYMTTYTGAAISFVCPLPAELNLDDIAHALSLQCRYAGHCRQFYSVAQHSVLVSRTLPPALRLEGLMHDAAEAYLQDMIRPLKRMSIGEEYCRYESMFLHSLAKKFNFQYPFPAEIHVADNVVLFTEKRDLLNATHAWKGEEFYQDRLLPETITPWSPENAEAQFKVEYFLLSKARRAIGR